MPSQTQAATATEGAIACAAPGAAGNTSSRSSTSLFAAPVTSYSLNPSSSAVDSVPASAIALPFGLTPSSTDLAGNPRSEGNGDCVTLQDKGALELPGHGTPCPTPPAPRARHETARGRHQRADDLPERVLRGALGRDHLRGGGKAKKYGAKVSYRDSQVGHDHVHGPARDRRPQAGQVAAGSPPSSNKHGKRCTLLTAIGSFTHVDIAGANSLHFSGRLKGKKLAAGDYRLQAVARNAAGNGAAVDKSFKIE